MIYRKNGTRYLINDSWEDRKNESYNYSKWGLNQHILSPKIVNTNNSVLKTLLSFYERSFIFLLESVDILKNFKNINWKNR